MISQSDLEAQLESTGEIARGYCKRRAHHDWTYDEVWAAYGRARGLLVAWIGFGVFAGAGVIVSFNAFLIAMFFHLLSYVLVCSGMLFTFPLRRTLVLMEKHNADTFSQLRRAVADAQRDQPIPGA